MTPHPWRLERHGAGFCLVHRCGSAVDRYPIADDNALTLADDAHRALFGLVLNAMGAGKKADATDGATSQP